LTSLNSSPKGNCEGWSGIITLSLITAEIEDQFLITSSLVKVPPEALSVRWSVASNFWLELTDQGIAL
jgi:hypothetical protein